MRGIGLVCALLAAACVAFSAGAQEGEDAGEAILEARITLALDRASVRAVIEAVAENTGMEYMAVDDALDMDQTVTLHITERPVEEVLEFLEDHLELDVDMGRLRETGVLVLSRREPEEEEEEERPEFAPQLDHAGALEMIRSHPTVARLLKRMPGLGIQLEWDGDDRRWEGEIRLGDDEVGEVRIAEYDDAKPRIVRLEIEIERDMVAPEPERREDF